MYFKINFENLHFDIGLYLYNARFYCTFYQAMVYYYYYIYTRGYLQQQVKAIKASSTNYMRITFNVRKIFHELFLIPENF